MTSVFDGRPIRRIQIGTDPPPARSPAEEHAQRLADRAATESRLKAAEPIWSTVQQAVCGGGGGGDPVKEPGPALVNAEKPSEASFDWTGHPDDFCY